MATKTVLQPLCVSLSFANHRRLQTYCRSFDNNPASCVDEALADWLECTAASRLEGLHRSAKILPVVSPARSGEVAR